MFMNVNFRISYCEALAPSMTRLQRQPNSELEREKEHVDDD